MAKFDLPDSPFFFSREQREMLLEDVGLGAVEVPESALFSYAALFQEFLCKNLSCPRCKEEEHVWSVVSGALEQGDWDARSHLILGDDTQFLVQCGHCLLFAHFMSMLSEESDLERLVPILEESFRRLLLEEIEKA